VRRCSGARPCRRAAQRAAITGPMRCVAPLRASFVLAACADRPGPTPTLGRYGSALKNHDFSAAYDLMSSSFRGKVSRDDYVRMMRDNGREVNETADRLRSEERA